MHCGLGVRLCGVLTVEVGTGRGAYHHRHPVVHGLWPQIYPFGDSMCIAPKDATPPQVVYKCYQQEGEPKSKNLWFEQHEWQQHGVCAGTKDADSFFSQVCGLAEKPLAVLGGTRAADLDLVDTADALQRSGYCVWNLESNSQIQLSACQDTTGKWHLVDVVEFSKVCGNGEPPVPSPPSIPPAETCIHGRHGPRCKSDSDCFNSKNCLRCAHSGFCTDIPLLEEMASVDLRTGTEAQRGDEPFVHSFEMLAAFSLCLTLCVALSYFATWRNQAFRSNLQGPLLLVD